MALPAVIVGFLVSVAAAFLMAEMLGASLLASLVVASLAGQAAFALVVAKALVCQSLRQRAQPF